MQELEDLKKAIANHDYKNALLIVDELEEMSKQDKINKIYSYCVVLLTHLIKQKVEQRSTRSWDVSIRNSIRQINRTNKRRKAGGYYLDRQELLEVITESVDSALDYASLEACEGIYSSSQIEEKIETTTLVAEALELIQNQ